MTLIVSETTAIAATQNLPEVAQSLWQDSLQTFPLVHTALELVALAAKAHRVSAVILPSDLENLEGFSLETYSLQVKSFRFSDALWHLAEEIHGVTFASRLCHQLAAFTHTPTGRAAYHRFIAPTNQVLCQVAGLTDC